MIDQQQRHPHGETAGPGEAGGPCQGAGFDIDPIQPLDRAARLNDPRRGPYTVPILDAPETRRV